MRALVFICINQHTKFEVHSFTSSNFQRYDWNKILKMGHVTLTMPIVIESHALDIFYLRTKNVANVASAVPEI